MAKTKPSKKSKKRDKSIPNGTTVPRSKSSAPQENPTELLTKATELLQTSQAEYALPLAQRALSLLRTSFSKEALLPALNVIAEINLELGDAESARESFLQAVEIDLDGNVPEISGGGSEKFLWLAQLSEEGGADSVKWFEKGVRTLKSEIGILEGSKAVEDILLANEKKTKLARALCGVVEIYMTDLSWEEDAESRCETLITEALLVGPNSAETLQTLASVRISQLRVEDAKAALSRSIDLWKDLPPEDPDVPDFAARISLSRLLMEVEMEHDALKVLERLIEEDDNSVEAWYLGGWCLFLLGEKEPNVTPEQPAETSSETPNDKQSSLFASRVWLEHSLKLYKMVDYEDERLRDHAQELVGRLDQELGPAEEEEEGSDDGDDWEDEGEDEGEGEGEDDDEEMVET